MKKYILLIAILFSISSYSQPITRGSLPGELYISTDWYMENYNQLHYAIFHSTDNGEHIYLKYENIETPPLNEMTVGQVIGDATPGALYNYGNNELWVSFNYGESWEYKEDYPGYTKFFSGVNQGLIFKGHSQGFFKSTDYAETFELLPITVICPFTEVGFSEPEFYGIYGEPGFYYNFVHTLDYGQTFTEVPIDSTVAFWSVMGHYPKISRGTESGELYLISWWLNSNYKIFHSVDTGNSWTEKYESDYIDIYYWRVNYTAGREPGTFYVMRSRINPSGDHIWLYIDYSSDYGETFTTYFHDLDSTITNTSNIKVDNIKISCHPNPFIDKISIKTRLKYRMIEIYDLNGKRYFTKILTQENKTEIIDLGKLGKGIYILKISTEGQDITKKIIKI